MGQVQQRLLNALGLALLLTLPAAAGKFCHDDPVQKEPKPISVEKVFSRQLSDHYDFFLHTFARPGQKQTKSRPIPAQGARVQNSART